MTCCAGPLIALGTGASLISFVMGIATRNPQMLIGGIIALILIPIGYSYYKKYAQTD